jgi:hypothetical protein
LHLDHLVYKCLTLPILQTFQVINAYARISSVETDSTSFISTFQARKLLGETGGIDCAKQITTWVRLIAEKCIGKNLVCAISLKSLQFCLHPAHTSTCTHL